MPRGLTCDDCYFRKNALCAMRPAAICPTFRVVRQGRLSRPAQAQLLEPAAGEQGPLLVGAHA